jgi:hemerythrin
LKLEWTSYIQTNHEEIDAQHKELFARMNSYFEASDGNSSEEKLISTLNYLVEYVKTHFKSEDTMMVSVSYPRIKEHRKSHKFLVEELVRLYKELIENGSSDEIHVNLFKLCQVWYVNHINEFDKRLAAYIKAYDKAKQTS